VNESFGRRFSPDREVLGRSVRIQGAGEWRTVVGVVSDAAVGTPSEGDERTRPERAYVPFAQAAEASPLLVARSTGDPSTLAPELRRMVAEVDPRIALWSVRTLADAHAWLTRIPRAMSWIAVAGGAAGVLVAAVGLYGLLAFRVRQRRRELGVRLALGADGRTLARETMGVAARQLLPALAAGLALAWLAAPILRVILVGGEPRRPSTYLGVGLAFLTVGLVAALVPALRAARTDPARVLRGG